MVVQTEYRLRADDGIAQQTMLRDAFMVWLQARHAFRNCITCMHFIEHMETCDLYKSRPPARIIANGCDSHTMEIPF